MTISLSRFHALVQSSLAWTLANRGSKYWQDAWEVKAQSFEDQVLKLKLFSEPYKPRDSDLRWWGQWSTDWHFSVSRLAMALSDFTFAVWVVLAFRVKPGPTWPRCLTDIVVYLIPAAATVYGIIMWKRTRAAPTN